MTLSTENRFYVSLLSVMGHYRCSSICIMSTWLISYKLLRSVDIEIIFHLRIIIIRNILFKIILNIILGELGVSACPNT